MIISAKTARYILIVSLIVAFAIVLPEFYSMLFYKSIPAPRVNYSPITNNFLFTNYGSGSVVRSDNNGNKLTREEFERLTPFFTYRQLLYREEMPDTIQGVPIEIQDVRLNNFYSSVRSSDIFKNSIPLNPLYESKPGRPDLQTPDEYFRIADEFQFINAAKNGIAQETSELFNNALIEKGFSFPAKKIFGNPTTKKPFDEGYFVTDNGGDLFHIKQVKGEPYVAKVTLPSNIEIEFISAREMELREFYALIITTDSRLFLISYDNYKLIELPSDGYDCRSSRLVFRGNLLFRELNFISKNSIKAIVTDRDYKIVDTYFEKWDSNEESNIGSISKSIFPFKISFTNNYNSYINFYVVVASLPFLMSNLVSLIIGIILFQTKFKRKTTTKIIDLFIILATGVYGLIAVLLVRDEN